jgi:hypothetical protein
MEIKHKEKPKSIVVKETTWLKMQEFIHHDGISSSDELIKKALESYEKELKGKDISELV